MMKNVSKICQKMKIKQFCICNKWKWMWKFITENETMSDANNMLTDTYHMTDSERVKIEEWEKVKGNETVNVFDSANVSNSTNVFDCVNVSAIQGKHWSIVIPLETSKYPKFVI